MACSKAGGGGVPCCRCLAAKSCSRSCCCISSVVKGSTPAKAERSFTSPSPAASGASPAALGHDKAEGGPLRSSRAEITPSMFRSSSVSAELVAPLPDAVDASTSGQYRGVAHLLLASAGSCCCRCCCSCSARLWNFCCNRRKLRANDSEGGAPSGLITKAGKTSASSLPMQQAAATIPSRRERGPLPPVGATL